MYNKSLPNRYADECLEKKNGKSLYFFKIPLAPLGDKKLGKNRFNHSSRTI